jgi:hypothetical protein
MSNRTDFNALAIELIEMFRLDAGTESDIGDTLLWRLKRELHNAFVAGQEQDATQPAPIPTVPRDAHPLLHGIARRIDGIDRSYAHLAPLRAHLVAELREKLTELNAKLEPSR